VDKEFDLDPLIDDGAEKSAIGTHPPKSMAGAMLLGLAAILTAAGGFGIWASTVPLDSAVIAHGKVSVAGKRKQIQHLEGGIVKAFAVKDGDHVNEGDMLVELDSLRPQTRLTIASTGYFHNLAAETRLIAERDAAPKIVWPEELTVAMTGNADLTALVKGQTELFNSRRNEINGQSRILESRIGRLREQINGFQAERLAADRQLGVAREELKTLTSLYERKFTTRMRLLATQREVYQLEGNIGRLDGQIASLAKEIGETDLTLAQMRDKHMTQVLDELKLHQSKVLEFREQMNIVRGEAQRTVIRAPVSGLVFNSQVHTIGGVLRPGDTILEIVPDNDRLIIEVRIRPQDVDNVHVGQPTEIRISAFKQRTTASLQGRVAFVAADTVSEPRSLENYYLAHVEVDAAELSALPGDKRLQAGMPAEAVIKTGARTAFAYLLQPLTESVNRAWREN
jgi:HlyD family type I secretion membrane fusion protein